MRYISAMALALWSTLPNSGTASQDFQEEATSIQFSSQVTVKAVEQEEELFRRGYTLLTDQKSNQAKGLKLIQKAATQNYGVAQSFWCIVNLFGYQSYIKADQERALQLCINNLHAASAQIKLGCDQNPEQICARLEEDDRQALKLYFEAISEEPLENFLNLNMVVTHTQELQATNIDTPFKLFKWGTMHEFGQGGLTKDDKEAVRFYQLAAKPEAYCIQMFKHDLQANGWEMSKENVINQIGCEDFDRLVAKSANPLAHYRLALMSMTARGGLLVDKQAAVNHLEIVAHHELAFWQAAFLLGSIYGSSGNGKKYVAAELLKRSALQKLMDIDLIMWSLFHIKAKRATAQWQ